MSYCFILFFEKLVSISQVFLTKNLRKSVAFSSKRSERSKELWKSFKPLQNDQNVHFSLFSVQKDSVTVHFPKCGARKRTLIEWGGGENTRYGNLITKQVVFKLFGTCSFQKSGSRKTKTTGGPSNSTMKCHRGGQID